MAAGGFSTPTGPQNQMISAYLYSVACLDGTYHVDGVMWVNAHTGKVKFHSKNLVTPWHGTFSVENDGVMWNVSFNARATSENVAIDETKITVVVKTSTHEWRGHDSQGNTVSLKLLSQFSWLHAPQVYDVVFGWSEAYQCWISRGLAPPDLPRDD